jgi:hypothetical protein
LLALHEALKEIGWAEEKDKTGTPA